MPQVEFAAVEGNEWWGRCEQMGLPLWVKPSRMGSSVGITRVTDLAELDAAVELALRHDPRVIVEASASGREVECSVLGNADPQASLPGEILRVIERPGPRRPCEPPGRADVPTRVRDCGPPRSWVSLSSRAFTGGPR